MQKITSKDNQIVKNISRLLKSAKARREDGAFITEGIRLCREALLNGTPIEYICFSESFLNKHHDISEEFQKSGCPSYLLNDALFSRICDTQSPQGILCCVKMLDKTVDSDTIRISGKILALENLQDPNNMGTILRTAEAFRIDGVVVSQDCCDIYSPKVVRGSMGAIFRQSIIVADDLPSFLRKCGKSGMRCFAAVLSENSVPVTNVVFPENSIVVIGNEGSGITEETVQSCTDKIIIPMSGKAESLNAAVAASILMWEMIK